MLLKAPLLYGQPGPPAAEVRLGLWPLQSPLSERSNSGGPIKRIVFISTANDESVFPLHYWTYKKVSLIRSDFFSFFFAWRQRESHSILK